MQWLNKKERQVNSGAVQIPYIFCFDLLFPPGAIRIGGLERVVLQLLELPTKQLVVCYVDVIIRRITCDWVKYKIRRIGRAADLSRCSERRRLRNWCSSVSCLARTASCFIKRRFFACRIRAAMSSPNVRFCSRAILCAAVALASQKRHEGIDLKECD